MIKINLLSDGEKENRKLESKMGMILRIGFSVVFVLLLLLAVTLSAQLVLDIYLKSARQESTAQSGKSQKDMADAEKLLKDVNTVSQRVGNTAGNIPHWSKIMARISRMCPEGLKITTVHAEKEHLKLAGFSKSREAFLKFQDGLRGEGFANLVSPVSNLVSPTDFSFTVEVDVDNKYLDQP